MTATVIVGIWLGLGGAALALQVTGLVTGSRFPTFGDAAGYVMRWTTGRLVVLAGWVWLGWHTFVRSHLGGP